MAATAHMSRKWLLRMSLVLIVFTGYGAYCIYDALWGYPSFNVEAEAYNGLLAEDREAEWPALAREKGWRERFHKDSFGQDGQVELKTEWDIRVQYIQLAFCLAIAVPVGLRLLWARSRTMAADDEGFLSVEGIRIPYDTITNVDRSRWERKSIAVVSYDLDGDSGTTKIDDWIFEGGEAVLLEIETITGLGPKTEDTQPAEADDTTDNADGSEQGTNA